MKGFAEVLSTCSTESKLMTVTGYCPQAICSTHHPHTHKNPHQASLKGSGVEMKECVGSLRQGVNKDVGLFGHGTASAAGRHTHQTHSADFSSVTEMPWTVCRIYRQNVENVWYVH